MGLARLQCHTKERYNHVRVEQECARDARAITYVSNSSFTDGLVRAIAALSIDANTLYGL